MIASEVRALATATSFDALFDAVSQLAAQLMSYHWLAVATDSPVRMGVHAHPASIGIAESRARAVLGVSASPTAHRVSDKDAHELDDAADKRFSSARIPFGTSMIARLAVAPTAASEELDELVALIARELGGAIKIATLVEDSQRLATTDSLTGLMNRRAFVAAAAKEIERCDRTNAELSVLLLDVDHFKLINDQRGHATGDCVLSALGALLPRHARPYDVVARWGGEEFVLALPIAGGRDACAVAERLRVAIESADVRAVNGESVKITASIGVARAPPPGESVDAMLDRADCAMYAAKTAGRNRVNVAPDTIATPEEDAILAAE